MNVGNVYMFLGTNLLQNAAIVCGWVGVGVCGNVCGSVCRGTVGTQ